MVLVLRAFITIVAMAGLAGPSLAAVCVPQVERHCQASEHSCCKGPRLSKCECGIAHGAVQAEPAQSATKLSSDGLVFAITPDCVVAPSLSHRPVRLQDPAPPPPTRERLSLLATLLV